MGSTNRSLAYANGLHRNSTVQKPDGIALSLIEIEERRRTFWSIYYLDTFLSLIFGRPPSISETDIDAELPQSVKDSLITADVILPEAMEAEREIYLYDSLRTLCVQLRKIYDELYSASASNGQTESTLIASITVLQNDLKNWRGSLPPEHMPLLSGQDSHNFVHLPPEKAYLSLGYYCSLCLILRPALVQLLRTTSEEITPQRSPRRGKSPARTINPSLTRSSEFEQYADQCVTAARDLLHLVLSGSVFVPNQLSYLHCSADLMVFRLVPPCTITSASIIVDNLIRQPHEDSAEEDLHLLQNVRQAIEASIDNALARPLLVSLNELERVALYAIRRDTPQLSRIPESQTHLYFPPGPSTSQPWQSYGTDNFVAGPLAYGMQFQEGAAPSSGLYQEQLTPVMQSYASTHQQIQYQFTSPETAGTSMPHLGPHTASSASIIQHPQDIQSSYPQTTTLQWGQNSTTGLSHPIMQPPSQQQQYPYPGPSWAPNVPNPPPQSPTRTTRGGHKKTPSRSARGRGAR